MRRRRRNHLGAKRGAAVAILLVVAAGLLVAWQAARPGRASDPTSNRVTEPVITRLRLVVPFETQHAGEIVAAQANLFEKAGLTVELKRRQASYDPVAAVVNGDEVFGVVDGATFLVARSRGAPIVAFSAGYLESPVVFFSLVGSGIRTPRDFVGKKVLRRANTDTAMIYDALLQIAGLSRSQMRETTSESVVDALVNRDIDVLPGHVAEYAYKLKEKGAEYNIVRPADYGIHVPGTVYFTTEKFAHDYPITVQRFVNALLAGWRMTYADTATSSALIASAMESSIPAERIRFELAMQRDFVLPVARRIGEFDERQWKQLHVILLITKMVDERADVSNAVDYSFLREAYRRNASAGF